MCMHVCMHVHVCVCMCVCACVRQCLGLLDFGFGFCCWFERWFCDQGHYCTKTQRIGGGGASKRRTERNNQDTHQVRSLGFVKPSLGSLTLFLICQWLEKRVGKVCGSCGVCVNGVCVNVDGGCEHVFSIGKRAWLRLATDLQKGWPQGQQRHAPLWL